MHKRLSHKNYSSLMHFFVIFKPPFSCTSTDNLELSRFDFFPSYLSPFFLARQMSAQNDCAFCYDFLFCNRIMDSFFSYFLNLYFQFRMVPFYDFLFNNSIIHADNRLCNFAFKMLDWLIWNSSKARDVPHSRYKSKKFV